MIHYFKLVIVATWSWNLCDSQVSQVPYHSFAGFLNTLFHSDKIVDRIMNANRCSYGIIVCMYIYIYTHCQHWWSIADSGGINCQRKRHIHYVYTKSFQHLPHTLYNCIRVLVDRSSRLGSVSIMQTHIHSCRHTDKVCTRTVVQRFLSAHSTDIPTGSRP